jgi:murein DD-endopeptidase MepM/ murein hydrolase activator NlpD
MDHFIIPAGGAFLDPLHTGDPHYGVDYANPDDYLNGKETYFYPVGPGYVTARSTCALCFVDGDLQGRVSWKWPQYNFGWGSLVLLETPYSPEVSIYALYAHLNRDLVSLGDYVTPDDVIGVVGSSGYSEEMHLHLEIRYGPPGQFWNADFSQPETLERWLATMFVSPALLVIPENHPTLVTALSDFVARRRDGNSIP